MFGRSLRDDIDFADVTLVCEDDQQIMAHIVILAASSSFFQNILMKWLLFCSMVQTLQFLSQMPLLLNLEVTILTSTLATNNISAKCVAKVSLTGSLWNVDPSACGKQAICLCRAAHVNTLESSLGFGQGTLPRTLAKTFLSLFSDNRL